MPPPTEYFPPPLTPAPLALPRCRRWPDHPAAVPLHLSAAQTDPARTAAEPHSQFRGVRQREWGTWVAEITDRNTGRRHWLGTFHSARQAAWAHDIANVGFHGSDCGELNFPIGSEEPVPDLQPVPHYVANIREAREDREARERLEVEAAGERYVADLRQRNPEHVAQEQALYDLYQARRSGASSSASPPAPTSAPS